MINSEGFNKRPEATGGQILNVVPSPEVRLTRTPRACASCTRALFVNSREQFATVANRRTNMSTGGT